MLANTLGSKIKLQQKQVSSGPLGQTVVWKPVADYHARVMPLDIKAIAQFQQLNTVASHRILMRGTIDIDLGGHRFLHKGDTYEPSQSAFHHDGVTEIIVRSV